MQRPCVDQVFKVSPKLLKEGGGLVAEVLGEMKTQKSRKDFSQALEALFAGVVQALSNRSIFSLVSSFMGVRRQSS